MPIASPWNSLEVAKLAIGILTPLLLLALGWIVSRATRRLEDAEWSKRRLIEKRIEIYDKMAPLANDIYCFFALVGHFLEIDPPAAVGRKRQLDKLFFVNRFLFEPAFADRYSAFIKACFRHFSETAKPAELRTGIERQKLERGATWKDEWVPYFASADLSDIATITATYEALMDELAAEIGVGAGGRGATTTSRRATRQPLRRATS